ncbi:hypothetical protein Nepgr_022149 [Nepenthes gracilis]|uniref:Uncharacterized protein n=1 Tax=Nepenthes gracilis TaxID=150966 RepID=A0AAD3XWP8_NEPGR|nr:hypothetical protein Nepgr_022149 [Nepenthes gracilis]
MFFAVCGNDGGHNVVIEIIMAAAAVAVVATVRMVIVLAVTMIEAVVVRVAMTVVVATMSIVVVTKIDESDGERILLACSEFPMGKAQERWHARKGELKSDWRRKLVVELISRAGDY